MPALLNFQHVDEISKNSSAEFQISGGMEFNKAERQFSAVMGPGLQMGSSKAGLPPISRRQARAGEEEETSSLWDHGCPRGTKML